MNTQRLSQFRGEVAGLTLQPGFDVIKGRSRRRRIRRRGVTAVAVALAFSLTGAAAWQSLANGHDERVLPGLPASSAGSRLPVDQPGGPVEWAGAGDANHLYAELSQCTGGQCHATLTGSDDGGKHWDVRQEPEDSLSLAVRGRTTLLSPPTVSKAGSHPLRVSVDGGRSWHAVTAGDTPQATMPAGGWLDCNSDVEFTAAALFPGQSCSLRVVDPVARTIRPLAAPPGVTPTHAAVVPVSAGLWILGMDDHHNATVSVSRDNAATWSTHQFGTPPTDPVDPSPTGSAVNGVHNNPGAYDMVQISTFDGQVVNAVLRYGQYAYGFRTADGGRTWQATNDSRPLPPPDLFNPAVTLPDGTHVLQSMQTEPRAAWFGQPPNADTYAKTDTVGTWPQTGAETSSDGYLVSRGDTHQIWWSTNGTTWQKITPN